MNYSYVMAKHDTKTTHFTEYVRTLTNELNSSAEYSWTSLHLKPTLYIQLPYGVMVISGLYHVNQMVTLQILTFRAVLPTCHIPITRP